MLAVLLHNCFATLYIGPEAAFPTFLIPLLPLKISDPSLQSIMKFNPANAAGYPNHEHQHYLLIRYPTPTGWTRVGFTSENFLGRLSTLQASTQSS